MQFPAWSIAEHTRATGNMAQTAITEDSIRAALMERLKATHVEVQDMSGTAPNPLPPLQSASLTSYHHPALPQPESSASQASQATRRNVD